MEVVGYMIAAAFVIITIGGIIQGLKEKKNESCENSCFDCPLKDICE